MDIITQIIGIGAMFFSVFSFQMNKHKHIMAMQIIASSPLMLIYNVLTGSIGGIINEVCVEISPVVGLLRYDIHRNPSK